MKSNRFSQVSVVIGAIVLVFSSTIASGGSSVTIRGTVTDFEGNPLPGVEVSAIGEESEIVVSASSKKNGKFSIKGLDSDVIYNLTFEKEGYVVATASLRPDPDDPQTITVTLPTVGGASPEEPAPATTATANVSGSPDPAQDISEARIAAIPVFNEGVAALEAEDLPTALEYFSKAAEIDPDFPQAWNATAAIALELKDFQAAADAAEEILRLQPDNLDAKGTAYFAELMIADIDRLIPSAERLADVSPEMVSNEMLQHARVLFDTNELVGSRALLDVILEREPELAPAYYQLGLTCNMQGDVECAKEALGKFLELAPDDPEAATAQSLIDYL